MVNVGEQAAKRGTEETSETVIRFRSQGAEENCCTVLRVKLGSQINIAAASPALPRDTGCATRSWIIDDASMSDVGWYK